MNKETVNLYRFQQTGPVSGESLKVYQPVKHVNSVVATHAHIVIVQPHMKGVSPSIVRRQSLKYVNNVSACVDQLSFVKHVPNVQTVV